MKKKILVIIVVIGIILLVGGIILTVFTPSKSTSSPKKNQTTEEILQEKVNNSANQAFSDLFDSSMDANTLKKRYGFDADFTSVSYGENSFLRYRSTVEANLKKYAKAQDYYANQVEKRMKDNFSYQLSEFLMADEGANIVQKVTFQSYYLELYQLDWSLLQTELLNRIGFNKNLADDLSNEDVQTIYKAKVKAMEIMNDYLDNYENKDEKMEYDLIYSVDGDDIGTLDYFSLLCNVNGIMYKVMDDIDVVGSPNYQLQQQRIQKYMSAVIGTTEDEVLALNYK